MGTCDNGHRQHRSYLVLFGQLRIVLELLYPQSLSISKLIIWTECKMIDIFTGLLHEILFCHFQLAKGSFARSWGRNSFWRSRDHVAQVPEMFLSYSGMGGRMPDFSIYSHWAAEDCFGKLTWEWKSTICRCINSSLKRREISIAIFMHRMVEPNTSSPNNMEFGWV